MPHSLKNHYLEKVDYKNESLVNQKEDSKPQRIL